MTNSPQSILAKAEQARGLSESEALLLLESDDPRFWENVFRVAETLTTRFFERKIFLFAPLYFGSPCVNDCAYCGFRRSNRSVARHRLSVWEFLDEATAIWEAGHRTLLLVSGEVPLYTEVSFLKSYLRVLKQARMDFSIGLELGPMKTDAIRELSREGIDRFVLYQETYDRDVYAKVHRAGPKKDYDLRLKASEDALSHGMTNLGIGALLGLANPRGEIASLVAHAAYLKASTGQGPASISLPRWQPASGLAQPGFDYHEVNDEEFIRMIAVLRLALPETGIVLTTREQAALRDRILAMGIGATHVSAGVCTEPGGYRTHKEHEEDGQFHLSDHRSLDEVAAKVRALGYRPIYDWKKQRFFAGAGKEEPSSHAL